jgi:hypothetical protein
MPRAAHKQAVPPLVLIFRAYSAHHSLAFFDIEGLHLPHDLVRFGNVDIASLSSKLTRLGTIVRGFGENNAVDPTNDRRVPATWLA